MNTAADTSTEHFKLRHVHAITGTFLLATLAILIAVIVFAGRSQRWFVGNVTLAILLPEAGAEGIRRGSEVYFLGTLVGTVSDVTVDPAGRMEAQVNIRRDFFLLIRADSFAVVKRKFGMVGDTYFEISRGQGKPLPETNARIVCNKQLPSALESAVEEVRREAVPALIKLSHGLDVWTTLGSNLVSTSDRLDHILARVDDITAQLQQGQGTAGRILFDPAAADELQTLLTKASASMMSFAASWRTCGTPAPIFNSPAQTFPPLAMPSPKKRRISLALFSRPKPPCVNSSASSPRSKNTGFSGAT
jgi:ABC-type transporter Mla subunit MlaD